MDAVTGSNREEKAAWEDHLVRTAARSLSLFAFLPCVMSCHGVSWRANRSVARDAAEVTSRVLERVLFEDVVNLGYIERRPRLVVDVARSFHVVRAELGEGEDSTAFRRAGPRRPHVVGDLRSVNQCPGPTMTPSCAYFDDVTYGTVSHAKMSSDSLTLTVLVWIGWKVARGSGSFGTEVMFRRVIGRGWVFDRIVNHRITMVLPHARSTGFAA